MSQPMQIIGSSCISVTKGYSDGSSGSSGGGARMRRDRTVRDAAEALVTLPVPEVIVEVGNN